MGGEPFTIAFLIRHLGHSCNSDPSCGSYLLSRSTICGFAPSRARGRCTHVRGISARIRTISANISVAPRLTYIRSRRISPQAWRNSSVLAAQQNHFGEAVFRAREAMRRGGGPDVNAAMLLASAVANDKPSSGGARARKWEDQVRYSPRYSPRSHATRGAPLHIRRARTRYLIWQVRELLVACTEAAPHDARHWETRLYLERKRGGAPAVRDSPRPALFSTFLIRQPPSSFGTFLIRHLLHLAGARVPARPDGRTERVDAVGGRSESAR